MKEEKEKATISEERPRPRFLRIAIALLLLALIMLLFFAEVVPSPNVKLSDQGISYSFYVEFKDCQLETLSPQQHEELRLYSLLFDNIGLNLEVPTRPSPCEKKWIFLTLFKELTPEAQARSNEYRNALEREWLERKDKRRKEI